MVLDSVFPFSVNVFVSFFFIIIIIILRVILYYFIVMSIVKVRAFVPILTSAKAYGFFIFSFWCLFS